MLSYEQAVQFLEGILGMPSTWRELLYNKPLEFLKLYMKRHMIRIPFQNMHMAAVDLDKRWFPSEQDIVTTMLAGKGGCCIVLNYFTKLVFQAIGLNSFVVRGDHYRAPIAGTHCLVMVKFEGPHAHGIYLVEVGGSFPILEPVPMQRLPYRTMQAGGFPYEFREIAPGWIGKFHLRGALVHGAFTDKDEILRTSWDLTPRGFWEFDYPMLETFTKPCYSALLKHPMLCRFFGNKEYRRLFPELPENMNGNAKKVLTTNRQALSKIGKGLASKTSPQTAAKTVPEPGTNQAQNKTPTSKEQGTNAKNSKTTTNGKNSANPASTITTPNGKVSTTAPKTVTTTNGSSVRKSATSSKIIITEESDEDYEMVTEEEVESEEDVNEDPKNFIFAWKRRIIVGDANARKVIKDYKSFEEMGVDLKKYFPTIPEEVIQKAMTAFSDYEPVETPYDHIM